MELLLLPLPLGGDPDLEPGGEDGPRQRLAGCGYAGSQGASGRGVLLRDLPG